MQQHDEDIEKLGVDVSRMLRALPRERQPDPALEEAIAQMLGSRGLLVTAGRRERMQRQRRRVAITWPAAAAAAVVLFVSGVIVGVSSGRVVAPERPVSAVASGASGGDGAQGAGDLLLAADKRTSVVRAIKF